MASRVNTKFVIMLAGVLFLVFAGVAGALVFVKMRSGDRYVTLGDKAMAQGDIKKADSFYAKAVGKERNNVAWLNKWRQAREQKIPETQSAYQEDYGMWRGIMRTLATAQKTNIDAHREYLDTVYAEAMTFRLSRQMWESVVSAAEDALRYFEPERPPQIRRYRGMAILTMDAISSQVTDEQRSTAIQDLRDAIAADPADYRAASQLAIHHRTKAERLAADPEQRRAAEAERATSADLLRGMQAHSPDEPFVIATVLSFEASDLDQAVRSAGNPAQAAAARDAATAAMKPLVERAFERLIATEPDRLSMETLERFISIALRADSTAGRDMTVRLIDRALASPSNPNGPELMIARARMLAAGNDMEGAIKEYQKVIALPRKPVSLAGLRLYELQRRCMFLQANTCLTMMAAERDPAKRADLGKRAAEHRQLLAQNVAADAPDLRLIDAKTLFMRDDLRGAQRLISEFLKAPGDYADQVLEANLIMADIGMRTNNPGLTAESLKTVQESRPDSPELLLMLAQVQTALDDRRAAAESYKRVLDMDPNNETARRELSMLEALAGTTRLEDPVLQLLAEADKLFRGDDKKLGDDRAAIAHLEAGLRANKHDPRLVIAIARLRLMSEDREGAEEALRSGLRERPGDEQLTRMLAAVEASDSLEGNLAAIEAAQLSELDKWLGRRQAYERFGKSDEAAKALAEAARISPEDPRVVELRFMAALNGNDLAGAERISETAVKIDADRSEGETFKARLLLARGNLREAAAMLTRSIGRGNANSAIYRLLANIQMQLGRGPDALTSLRRALELNPVDLQTIKMYIACLAQLEQQQEALTVAQRSEKLGQRDPEFMNSWLALEAMNGNLAFAQERREQLLARNPRDKTNAAALIALYMDQRDWGKARSLLDRQRAADDSTQLVSLDARWHAERGDMNKAREIFVKHIDDLGQRPEPMTAEPYLVFGQFMLQRGQTQVGLNAIRQAARFQDPKTRNVDIALGDLLLSLGRPGEAEAAYRGVLVAGIPDDNHRIRKRCLEAMLQQGKAEEAGREIESIGAAADEDLELLTIKARIARDKGDMRRARELLDRAIAKFPDEPLPYLQRARMNTLNPALVNDAMADLNTAVRLRPGSWQLLRARANLQFSQGRTDEGLRDLQTAYNANPNVDAIRVELLGRLLKLGRESEAADIADGLIRKRPTDAALIGSTGDIFARAGSWGRASRFYRQLWTLNPDERSAIAYVESLMNMSPPGLAEADPVFNAPALKTPSAALLLTRASVRKKQGRNDAARSDLIAALEACGSDQGAMLGWVDRAITILTPKEVASLLESMRARPGGESWVNYLRGRAMLDDKDLARDGESVLRQIVDGSGENSVRLVAARTLSLRYNNEERWEEAMAVTQAGLSIAPDDVMLNNNAAYFLSEHLNKAQEALSHSEKAAAGDPYNDRIFDTLAAVHWRLGNRPKALEAEMNALRLARTEADKARWALKLADWRLQSGDKAGAEAMLNLVRELMLDQPQLSDMFKDDLARITESVRAAR